MTTQDIDRLEQGLEQKQHVARTDRRRRVWEVAVAACAVTGVVLGALALRDDPAPPNVPAGPPGLTTTDLAGIWRVDDEGSGWLWMFTADGKVIHSEGPTTSPPPEATGWTVIPAPGGFKTVNETAEWRTGADACHVMWAATISAEGRMKASVGEASSSCTIQRGESWEWTRVSPVSVAGASATTLWPTSEVSPVDNGSNVVGTWLFPGTGTLLAITPSGDYAIRTFDTLYRPETGTVSVTRAGSLVFTPSSNPTCTIDFEKVTTRNSTLDATLADGSCGRLTGATDTWIRIN